METRVLATWAYRATMVLISLAIAAVAWVDVAQWLGGGPPRISLSVPKEPIPIQGAVIEGSRAATVGVIEYSDLECPVCSVFATTQEKELRTRYVDRGSVLWIYRQNPLVGIHRFALTAARVVDCAERQGKFQPMRLWFYEHQANIGAYEDALPHIGVDGAMIRACLQNPAFPRIESDINEAMSLRVVATPSFVVGRVGPAGLSARQTFTGMPPSDTLARTIDALLSEGSDRR